MLSTLTHSIEAEWQPDWGTQLPVGTDIEIVVELSVSWERDGIGAYEFWGQKCFDAGNLRPEEFASFAVESVRVNGAPVSFVPPKSLCDFAEVTCDETFDSITDGIEPPEPDYQEHERDRWED